MCLQGLGSPSVPGRSTGEGVLLLCRPRLHPCQRSLCESLRWAASWGPGDLKSGEDEGKDKSCSWEQSAFAFIYEQCSSEGPGKRGQVARALHFRGAESGSVPSKELQETEPSGKTEPSGFQSQGVGMVLFQQGLNQSHSKISTKHILGVRCYSRYWKTAKKQYMKLSEISILSGFAF